MTAEPVHVLRERLEQALRDGEDLADQVAAGELTGREAEPLRRRYERVAADTIAALDLRTDRRDDEPAPEPEESSSAPGTPRRRARAAVVGGLLAAAVVCGSLVALPAFVGDRPPGGYVTGNDMGGPAPATTARSAGRDLSTVTDAELARVVAANPDVIGMRVALADRYAAKGRYEQATTHYLAALKRDPGSAEAQAGLAWVLFQTGQADQALPLVDRALRTAPALPRALWTKANILLYARADPGGALDLLHRMERTSLPPEVRKQVAALVAMAESRRSGG